MMREVGYSHFGQIGHMVWFCVPCKLEMHGSKEIDYHFETVHNLPGDKVHLLFNEGKLESRPNCIYLMVDCRESRGVNLLRRSPKVKRAD